MMDEKHTSVSELNPLPRLIDVFDTPRNIPKVLPAMKVESPPTIDANLNDECWINAPMAVNFTDRNNNGNYAKNQTIVKLVYTDNAIYTAWYLYDDQPENIIASVKKDQVRLYGDDWISFTIDPFHTHQFSDRSFFMVNPIGSKFVNNPPQYVYRSEIPNLWNVAADIVNEGWIVEMEIPWKMLNYPSKTEPLVMGINFDRWQERTGENSWWSNVGFREDDRPDGHWLDVLPPQNS